MDIKQLKKYHKNPRKITESQHKHLEETMQEYGDLSGIVVNLRNNEIIGGNQRTSILQKYPQEARIDIIESFPSPDEFGTLRVGFVTFRGNKFAYREVNWDEEKEARANLIANKAGGFWDNDMLSSQFEDETLLAAGFQDFEIGTFDPGKLDLESREKDENTLDRTLDTYLEGSIKQIVLYFKKEEYDGIIERMEHLQEVLGFENFTEVFEEILTAYENSKGL